MIRLFRGSIALSRILQHTPSQIHTHTLTCMHLGENTRERIALCTGASHPNKTPSPTPPASCVRACPGTLVINPLITDLLPLMVLTRRSPSPSPAQLDEPGPLSDRRPGLLLRFWSPLLARAEAARLLCPGRYCAPPRCVRDSGDLVPRSHEYQHARGEAPEEAHLSGQVFV